MARFVCVIGLVMVVSFGFADTGREDAPEVRGHVTHEPVLLERNKPRYPSVALHELAEGWVRLGYVVDETGQVREPIVIDSNGNRNLEHAALAAVRNFVYQPATVNGEPVPWVTEFRMEFEIEDPPMSARPTFVRQYRSILRMIESGRLDQAAERLARLDGRTTQNLYEDAFRWLLHARYRSEIGDGLGELHALRRATGHQPARLPEDMQQWALGRLFILRLLHSHLADALGMISRADGSVIEGFEETAAELRSAIDGPAGIAVSGRLDASGGWTHVLARRSFTFDESVTGVDEVLIRCPRQRQTARADTELVWTLPTAEGCTVVVRGEAGRDVVIYELPEEEVGH
jgi:TonB family protein